MVPRQIQSPEESFVVANNDFMKRLRWKDYNGAAKYFTEGGSEPFLEQLRQTEKDLNITDVRLDSAEFHAPDQTMASWLVVDYFLLPSNSLKSFRFELQWHYREGGEKLLGTWRITSHFPPFPGVSKP